MAFTSLYSHPLEHVVSNMGPVGLGTLLLGSHVVTAWIWFVVGEEEAANEARGLGIFLRIRLMPQCNR